MINIKINNAFITLGNWIGENVEGDEVNTLALQAKNENPWFTKESVTLALTSIRSMLEELSFQQWLARYHFANKNPKTVALVLAGNIPLVGFHDILCVLTSGHKVMIKLSSKDSVLMKFILNKVIEMEPLLSDLIIIVERLANFDAVIATGSDNSSRYFDYYFGKYPHIIRKNRTSIALLDGFETPEELALLGSDVFSYFGLGCRNVSKLYAPKGYSFPTVLDNWEGYVEVKHHHKYRNNYDYQLAIGLVNSAPMLDNGFVLLKVDERLVSPIGVVYTELYESEDALNVILKEQAEKIQCIVGNKKQATVPYGQAQQPTLADYADGVDTMKFLMTL